MSKRRGIRLVDLSLGPIPAEVINLTLGLDLDPGPVILSRNAQKHALSSHPVEYPPCLPHVAAVVADPLNLGDDFKNGGKIEMIGRVPAPGSFLLVAVTIERDPAGRYNVCSFYPISEKKIQPRRARGYLRRGFKALKQLRLRFPGAPARSYRSRNVAGMPNSGSLHTDRMACRAAGATLPPH